MSDPVNDPSFFNGCARPGPFHKLLFGLCFFHAFVQERLKFGPLGWNVPYQFSAPDFVISARQLLMFLNEFPDMMPLKALRYLTGECNYGGRVTDAHDRRTLMSILAVFYTDATLDDDYKFSPSGLYYAPPDGSHEEQMMFIRNLPITAAPEVFGLHANADITKDQQETDLMLESILSMQGASGSTGGVSREALLTELAADIDRRVQPVFDIEAARYKYPVDYYESMNTVLTQELVRFNRLLEIVHASLKNLQKALKGLVLMSGDLEAVGNAMFDGKVCVPALPRLPASLLLRTCCRALRARAPAHRPQSRPTDPPRPPHPPPLPPTPPLHPTPQVPALWMGKSYPSQKPLGGYVNELIERCDMLQSWLDVGPPPSFWISGFYFTHAFLTGVKQNYARKYKIPIDTVSFDYTCLPEGTYDKPAVDGAYVHGMSVEGARWDYVTMQLAESHPKVLYSAAPTLLLSPCIAGKEREFPAFEVPLYRTPERRGVLATTGHSTNYVMPVKVPSNKPSDHWVRRGVAFLLSLAQ